MTPEQFAYWLQGFAEMAGATPTDEQWKMIKDHLATVFNKVTPTFQKTPNLEELLESMRQKRTPLWPIPNYQKPDIIC